MFSCKPLSSVPYLFVQSTRRLVPPGTNATPTPITREGDWLLNHTLLCGGSYISSWWFKPRCQEWRAKNEMELNRVVDWRGNEVNDYCIARRRMVAVRMKVEFSSHCSTRFELYGHVINLMTSCQNEISGVACATSTSMICSTTRSWRWYICQPASPVYCQQVQRLKCEVAVRWIGW